jgi:hypothetical protein
MGVRGRREDRFGQAKSRAAKVALLNPWLLSIAPAAGLKWS